MSLYDYLKNIFLILLILQIAPSLITGLTKQYKKLLIPQTKVAVLEMKGAIYNSDYHNKKLNSYFEDDDIKAILIKMDCPGCASGSAQAIFNEITILKKEYPNKPIVTLVENICASGGYYIACATDAIIAPSSALIGSIGANLSYLFQLQDFMEQYKIKYESVAAGKYKTAVDPFINITPDDKEMLQQVTNDSYDQFAQDVASMRKQVSLNNKEVWADGKIFTARQALQLGLIDKLGSARNAIDTIKDMALIKKDEKIEWIRPVQKTGFWSLFGGGQDEEGDSSSMFSLFIKKIRLAFENGHLLSN